MVPAMSLCRKHANRYMLLLSRALLYSICILRISCFGCLASVTLHHNVVMQCRFSLTKRALHASCRMISQIGFSLQYLFPWNVSLDQIMMYLSFNSMCSLKAHHLFQSRPLLYSLLPTGWRQTVLHNLREIKGFKKLKNARRVCKLPWVTVKVNEQD